ncbi:MAG TPA: hypothetical protein VKI43_17695 [Vicinamibacterales bacterium]|nr:hypothetical protein [Vicinamibacterales bacterium]
MTDRWNETLSRLIDGDPVDPGVVAEALESPDGRRLLVDFTAVRAAFDRDTAAPSAAFLGQMQSALAAAEPHPAPRAGGFPLRLVALAAAAALLLGVGFENWRHRRVEAPPSAARVLRFETSEWTSVKGGGR